jgi:hypothetical protein
LNFFFLDRTMCVSGTCIIALFHWNVLYETHPIVNLISRFAETGFARRSGMEKKHRKNDENWIPGSRVPVPRELKVYTQVHASLQTMIRTYLDLDTIFNMSRASKAMFQSQLARGYSTLVLRNPQPSYDDDYRDDWTRRFLTSPPAVVDKFIGAISNSLRKLVCAVHNRPMGRWTDQEGDIAISSAWGRLISSCTRLETLDIELGHYFQALDETNIQQLQQAKSLRHLTIRIGRVEMPVSCAKKLVETIVSAPFAEHLISLAIKLTPQALRNELENALDGLWEKLLNALPALQVWDVDMYSTSETTQLEILRHSPVAKTLRCIVLDVYPAHIDEYTRSPLLWRDCPHLEELHIVQRVDAAWLLEEAHWWCKTAEGSPKWSALLKNLDVKGESLYNTVRALAWTTTAREVKHWDTITIEYHKYQRDDLLVLLVEAMDELKFSPLNVERLSLPQCNLEGSSLQSLSELFGQHLPLLRHLDVEDYSCDLVTDKTMAIRTGRRVNFVDFKALCETFQQARKCQMTVLDWEFWKEQDESSEEDTYTGQESVHDTLRAERTIDKLRLCARSRKAHYKREWDEEQFCQVVQASQSLCLHTLELINVIQRLDSPHLWELCTLEQLPHLRRVALQSDSSHFDGRMILHLHGLHEISIQTSIEETKSESKPIDVHVLTKLLIQNPELQMLKLHCASDFPSRAPDGHPEQTYVDLTVVKPQHLTVLDLYRTNCSATVEEVEALLEYCPALRLLELGMWMDHVHYACVPVRGYGPCSFAMEKMEYDKFQLPRRKIALGRAALLCGPLSAFPLDEMAAFLAKLATGPAPTDIKEETKSEKEFTDANFSPKRRQLILRFLRAFQTLSISPSHEHAENYILFLNKEWAIVIPHVGKGFVNHQGALCLLVHTNPANEKMTMEYVPGAPGTAANPNADPRRLLLFGSNMDYPITLAEADVIDPDTYWHPYMFAGFADHLDTLAVSFLYCTLRIYFPTIPRWVITHWMLMDGQLEAKVKQFLHLSVLPPAPSAPVHVEQSSDRKDAKMDVAKQSTSLKSGQQQYQESKQLMDALRQIHWEFNLDDISQFGHAIQTSVAYHKPDGTLHYDPPSSVRVECRPDQVVAIRDLLHDFYDASLDIDFSLLASLGVG